MSKFTNEDEKFINDILRKRAIFLKNENLKDLNKETKNNRILYYLAMKTTQSRSICFEKEFHKTFPHLNKNKAKDEIGDFNTGNKNIEYKVSVLDNITNRTHIVQIRLAQPVDYVIEIIDIRNLDDINSIILYLTKQQMEDECFKLASAAHGKKIKAKELRITLKDNTEDFNRWINDYKFDKKLINA